MAIDHYVVLGINYNATPEEIKRAYRERARQVHPDFNNGSTESHEQFLRVHEAYEVLRNTQRRRDYNLTLIVNRDSAQESRRTAGLRRATAYDFDERGVRNQSSHSVDPDIESRSLELLVNDVRDLVSSGKLNHAIHLYNATKSMSDPSKVHVANRLKQMKCYILDGHVSRIQREISVYYENDGRVSPSKLCSDLNLLYVNAQKFVGTDQDSDILSKLDNMRQILNGFDIFRYIIGIK